MCDARVMHAVMRHPAATTAPAVRRKVDGFWSAGRGEVIDLTHEHHAGFPTASGQPGFSAKQVADLAIDGFSIREVTTSEHSGTHIDTPLHFSEHGLSVSELPVEDLVAPLVILDISARAAVDPDSLVMPEDLDAWIERNGALPPFCCVAMDSGWTARVDGDGFLNRDSAGRSRFPGFHIRTIERLLETDAIGIAVDTLSLDGGISMDYPVHRYWLPTGRWGVECIANLDRLPEKGATIVVGAPKFRGGTGGPSRIFALT